LQNYIDNLDDRGFTEVVDGKLIFKKDVTKEPGTIYRGIAHMLGHQSKVNKIVEDLKRMGAINAEVTLDDKGDMVYTPQMEISNVPNTFATYNYEGGTTDWNRPGKYTGFTTPATHPLGTQTFPSTGTFGSPDYVSSWTNYINTMFTGFQKVKKTEPISTIVPTKYTPVENQSKLLNDQLVQKRKQELHEQEVIKAKEKTKQEVIKTQEIARETAVKKQAQEIIDKPEYQQQFKKDIEKTNGKSYTQSKIEEAARTGKYTGF
jgi:hypothetical protein